MVEAGITVTDMTYHDRDYNLLMGVDFDGLIGKTRFPFYLLIPQTATERVLNKRLDDLGISVFRPYKAVGMRANPKDSRLADVSFEDGQSITAQYVIGADGPQSTVCTWIPSRIIPVLTVTIRYVNYQT
jgi:2-polyprenyl-6-methoxyphenol hydroxylase-like FAD-dependent oxidoreductase